MQNLGQGIRPSQFITTYGSGALLEGIHGPRIILNFEDSGLFSGRSVNQFEVHDEAVRLQLPENSRLFRLPTNSDLQRPDNESIFNTRAFPSWSLCIKHGKLYRVHYNEKSKHTCPDCPPHRDSGTAWTVSRMEAVGLVMACDVGHLSDVDWIGLAHSQTKSSDCKPGHICWDAEGSALRNVTLRCPNCKSSANLGELYLARHRCSGNFVEVYGSHENCTRQAKILQRGASDIFIPEVIASVAVPRLGSALAEALRHDKILPLAKSLRRVLPNRWVPELLVEAADAPKAVREALEAATPEEVERVFESVQAERDGLTPETAKLLEFQALCQAASGNSPNQDGHRQTLDDFEVDAKRQHRLNRGSWSFTVTPVNRLKVVMAQRGYRRRAGQVVDRYLPYKSERWYPAVELFGEGLFIQVTPPPNAWKGSVGLFWTDRALQTGEVTHRPEFVWWHSLSHRLIRALSIYSGYSAASVRERIYVDPTGQGGLLLYAVQPGGDGTLGGLIALAPNFGTILDAALADIDICSNDPFCSEAPRTDKTGPACYTCLLVSETSCEHRNHCLDRTLLVETFVEH